jgi:hypothetical protein
MATTKSSKFHITTLMALQDLEILDNDKYLDHTQIWVAKCIRTYVVYVQNKFVSIQAVKAYTGLEVLKSYPITGPGWTSGLQEFETPRNF